MKTGFKAELADLELYKIELDLERRVIADIRKRQRAIPGLRQDDYGYTATWGRGGLTRGVKIAAWRANGYNCAQLQSVTGIASFAITLGQRTGPQER